MKTILITGHAGIVGTILSDNLTADHTIIGLDKSDCDISDFNSLKSFFAKCPKIDVIIHLAADAYPFASWDLVLQHNVVGTRNIYEMAKLMGIKKIIFASSTHVVGKYPGYPFKIDNLGRKLTVNDPFQPDEFYGWSKASGEILARLYFDLHGIYSTILRIGHVLAPGQKKDLDLEKFELTNDDLVKFVHRGLSETGFHTYFAVSDHQGGFLELI